jgi:hypothetical protein
MGKFRMFPIMMAVVLVLGSVAARGEAMNGQGESYSFGDDVAFLTEHTDAFVLTKGASRVAVVPQYQGRVMTSTSGGADGLSLGWVNRKLIASGTFEQHINVFGGEDRFWLGPEGGQYAIFFAPGTEFTLDDWFTPAPIDTEPYKLVRKLDDSALFRHDFALTNKSGTTLQVGVDREICLLDRAAAVDTVGMAIPDGVSVVAYETRNRVTNAGDSAWKKETGLLSIWILGMYNPSDGTTMVIPIRPGPEAQLGYKVNDTYFGKIPADRLVVKDDIMFFKGDGKQRGKLGVNPQRSKGVAGSYDAANRVLTVVWFNQPKEYVGYVNNMWELQKEPYSGDAIMSYNDGPLGPGLPPLGPFYELETSSPALALYPNESYLHVHRTIHMQGAEADLNAIAQKMFGVGLETVKNALK